MTDNKIIKSLGHYKVQMETLNNCLKKYIEKNIWPLTNIVLKQQTITLIEEIQWTIARLESLNKTSEALRYVGYFCFTLANRLLVIDNIRTNSLNTARFHTNEAIFKNVYDYKTCFFLVVHTHPKYLKMDSTLEVDYIEVSKKDGSKEKVLGNKNIIDSVLQLQMLTFLDPLIDTTLGENFYAFRQDRSALEAIAHLCNSIHRNYNSNYYLIHLQIKDYFYSISHKFVLERFPFPQKYKQLLIRWIKCIHIKNDGKKINMQSGVPEGSIIGPIICNFILSFLIKDLLKDSISQNTLLNTNISTFNSVACIINYADSLMIKVTGNEQTRNVLKILERKLLEASLKISEEKTNIYNLSTNIKFDWLGYSFLIIHNKNPYSNKVKKQNNKKKHSNFKKNEMTLLYYISNNNFNLIKQKLKEEIKKLKHKDLYGIIKKINYILKDISYYYGFRENRHRLDYLQYFIDKIFWRSLVEKYRYKGIRRTQWVAQTFFLTPISPLGLKWHLHCINDKDNLKNKYQKNKRILWGIKVNKFFELKPMSINLLPEYLKTKCFYLAKTEFDSHYEYVKKCRRNKNRLLFLSERKGEY